eukprot:m.66554 g.66554  ORF g.66554 m.66554 type:complete len:220 (-) comp14061_c0_seq2:69-728(-)
MPPKRKKLIVDDDDDDDDYDMDGIIDDGVEEDEDSGAEQFEAEEDFLQVLEEDNAKRTYSDSSKLTSRQRAMMQEDDPFQERLQHLPLTTTKALTTEEQEEKTARREAANRRRQLLVKQRAEDEKRAVVEKLLKQQKHSKAATGPVQRQPKVIAGPSIRTIYSTTVTTSYSSVTDAPVACVVKSAPLRPECVVCNQPSKYAARSSGARVCSLACYTQVN